MTTAAQDLASQGNYSGRLPNQYTTATPTNGGYYISPDNSNIPGSFINTYPTGNNYASNNSAIAGLFGGSYAPEYSQANISDLTNQLAAILEPQYQRAGSQVMANAGGTLGTALGNPLQLMQNQKLSQLAQFAQGLQTQGLGATREERMLGEQRNYEQPFREAPITGVYNGSPTASYASSMLPYVTSGLMNQSVLGKTLSGNVNTERSIDPTWWASKAAGFQSPYTQSQYMANPDQYKSIYNPTVGNNAVNQSNPYNYYSPTGSY